MPRIWKVVELVGEFRFMWSFTCVCDVCTWMTTWKGCDPILFSFFFEVCDCPIEERYFSQIEKLQNRSENDQNFDPRWREEFQTQFGSPWWNRFPNPLLFFPSEDLCQRPFTNREVHPPIAWLERHRKSMLFFWVFLLNRAHGGSTKREHSPNVYNPPIGIGSPL